MMNRAKIIKTIGVWLLLLCNGLSQNDYVDFALRQHPDQPNKFTALAIPNFNFTGDIIGPTMNFNVLFPLGVALVDIEGILRDDKNLTFTKATWSPRFNSDQELEEDIRTRGGIDCWDYDKGLLTTRSAKFYMSAVTSGVPVELFNFTITEGACKVGELEILENDPTKMDSFNDSNEADCLYTVGRNVNNTWTVARNGLDVAGATNLYRANMAGSDTVACPLNKIDITKKNNNSTPEVGETVTYTITVSNSSASVAENVVVTDTMPSGLQFVSADNGGTHNNSVIAWNLGTLTANETKDLTYSATVNAGTESTTQTNIASVVCKECETNNPSAATNTVTVSEPTVANVSIKKSASPTNPSAGDIVNYTLVVTNAGPAAAANIAVKDTLPVSKVDYQNDASDGGSFSSPDINWTIANVAPNSSQTLTYSVRVKTGTEGETIENVAVATCATCPVTPPETNVVSVSSFPNLTMTKASNVTTPNPGDTVNYTITLSNTGAKTATNVVVQDTLPSGLINVSSINEGGTYSQPNVNWTISTLPVNATKTLTYSAVVAAGTEGQTLENVVAVTSCQNCQSNPPPVTNSITSTAEANVTLKKSANRTSADVGDTINYTIILTNAGPSPASFIAVTDTIPASKVTYLNDANEGGQYTSPNIAWSISTLAPNSSKSLTYSVRVNTGTEGETLTNVVVSSCSVCTVTPPATNTVDITSDPIITLIKTATPTNPEAGGTVNYTITVTNSGTAEATDVAVVDELPSEVDYNNDASDGGTYDPGSQTIGWLNLTVAPNTSKQLTYSATVKSGTAGGTDIQNIASGNCGNCSSTVVPPVTNTVTVPTPTDSEIAMSKTADKTTAAVGDTITYTLSVTNKGPGAASSIVLTDVIPDGLTFASADNPQPTRSNQTLTWNIANIQANNTMQLIYRVTVDASAAGRTLTNNAVLACSTCTGETNPPPAVITIPNPNIVLSKSATPSNPEAGGTVSYTITVLNNGSGDASNVVINDLVPQEVDYNNDASGGGIYNAGPRTINWNITTLAANANQQLTYSATVKSGTAGGTDIQNIASGECGNCPTSTIPPVTNTVTVPAPTDSEIAMSKTADKTTVAVGDTITYTLSVTNKGPGTASNIVLTDVIPDGLTFASADNPQPTRSNQTLTWNIANIQANNTMQLIYRVTVDANAAGRTLTNNAVLACSTCTGETNPPPAVVNVSSPNVVLSKSATPSNPGAGGTVNYTITVANTGTEEATSVRVFDTLPTEVDYNNDASDSGTYSQGSLTITWLNITLAPNASKQLTYSATVKSGTAGGTVIRNVATGICGNCPTSAIPPVTNTVTVSSSTDSEIAMSKTADKATAAVGDTITYTLSVTNKGPATANSIVLTDVIPDGLTFVSADNPQPTRSNQTLTWNIANIQANNTMQLIYRVTVDASAAGRTLTNNAVLACSTCTGETNPPPAVVTIPNPNIVLSKSATPSNPEAGGTVSYTITVLNNGSADASNVVINDLVPQEVDYNNDATDGGIYTEGTRSIVWNISRLAANANKQLTYSTTVKTGTSAGTQIENIVNGLCQNCPTNPTPVTNTVTVASANDSDIAMSKTVDDTTPLVGGAVTYTIAVTNKGPATATGVVVTDVIPNGLTFRSANNPQPTRSNQTLTWNIASIQPNNSIQLVYQVEVDANSSGLSLTNIAVLTCPTCMGETNTPPVVVTPGENTIRPLDDFNVTFINTAVSGNVLVNDTDPEGNTLRVVSSPLVQMANGQLQINSQGNYTYTPNNGFTGKDTALLNICDDGLPEKCEITRLVVTVQPTPDPDANDPPIANNDTVVTPKNTSVPGNVLPNDSDPDGDTITVNPTLITQPTHGDIVQIDASGNFTYVPDTDYVGEDTFSYKICDNGNPSLCDTATVYVKVVEDKNGTENDPPNPVEDFEEGPINTDITGNMLDNDNEPNGDPMTVSTTPVKGPDNGTVTINPNGTFTYTPNANYSGPDSFQYEVCDDKNACATTTVHLLVNPINHLTPINDFNVTYVNTPVSGNVLINDIDPEGNTLTVNTAPVVGPANGSLSLQSDGTYTYTPNNNFTGEENITLQVCDNGNPQLCKNSILNIKVLSSPVPNQNDPPLANDDTALTRKNTPVTGEVLDNDSDPDNNPLTIQTTPVSGPDHGTVQISNDGTYTYTPDNNYVGDDNFTYKICDNGNPALCDEATVYIKVTEDPNGTENDPPTPIEDFAEGDINTPITGDLLDNDSDPNGDTITPKTTPVSGPQNGTVTINPNGTFTYTPNTDYTGPDSFVYEICDDKNACAQTTVHLLVRPLGGSLGNFVWDDQDKDGVQDPGEPGISGVTVQLESCVGNVLSTTTTTNGIYTFSNLQNANYRIRFIPPTGWTFTTADVGSDSTDSDASIDDAGTGRVTDCFALDAGEEDVTRDAGLVPASGGIKIDKTVYVGNNGESGCPGTEKVVSAVGSTVTYCFRVENTGQTYLAETLITDNSISYSGLVGTLAPGQVSTKAHSVVVQQSQVNTASVSGKPSDQNGTPFSSSPVASDTDTAEFEAGTINLTLSKTVVIASGDCNDGTSTFTGEEGLSIKYCLKVSNSGSVTMSNIVIRDPQLLGSGSFFISQLAAGATETKTANTTIGNSGVTNVATVTSTDPNGNTVTNTDTAIVQVQVTQDGIIRGRVFQDLNTNNSHDQGTDGYFPTNVVVTLYSAGPDGVVGSADDSVLTVANASTTDGSYTFGNLADGTYYVVVDTNTIPENWVIGSNYSITNKPTGHQITSNTQTIENSDFGFTFNGIINGYVYWDIDSSGTRNENMTQRGLSGVTIQLSGVSSTGASISRSIDTSTRSGTTEKGYYEFNNLPPGNYTVSIVKTDAQTAMQTLLNSSNFEIKMTTPESSSAVLSTSSNTGSLTANGTVSVDFGVNLTTTAVSLKSFTALAQENGVLLAWETGSEKDNLGFNLYRAETEESEKIKINTQIIPALNVSTGGEYSWTDTEVSDGIWYYWLEDVDFDGTLTLHGPRTIGKGGDAGETQLIVIPQQAGIYRVKHNVLAKAGLNDYDRITVKIDGVEVPTYVIENKFILFYIPEGSQEAEFSLTDSPLRMQKISSK